MMTLYDHFNEQDRFMIVETARMLLAAGSRTDEPVKEEPLDYLVIIKFSISSYRYLSQVRMLSNHYLLIAELIQLLLTHGGDS